MPGKHLQFPLTVGPLTAVPTDSCLILQLSDLTVVWSYSCPHWQLSDLTVVWSYSCLILQLISDSCLLTIIPRQSKLKEGRKSFSLANAFSFHRYCKGMRLLRNNLHMGRHLNANFYCRLKRLYRHLLRENWKQGINFLSLLFLKITHPRLGLQRAVENDWKWAKCQEEEKISSSLSPFFEPM